MKKIFLISVAILALAVPGLAHSAPRSFNVLLAGGTEPNAIDIWLTSDGRSYVIDSSIPLEVGGTICTHPAENMNELVCDAPLISSFEVHANGGDDRISVAASIDLPVVIRAGSGHDYIRGGAGPDRLIGGPGNDRLLGGGGDDFLSGGPEDDVLLGGPGNDILIRGPGSDVLRGGPGDDLIRPFPGKPGTP
jgi:Ca2+-binding RTX toxin-like protein